MKQLTFPCVSSWPIAPVPHRLQTKQKRLAKLLRRYPCDWPVEPNLLIMQAFLRIGRKRLSSGHTRKKIDTPKQSELNQLQWVHEIQLIVPAYLSQQKKQQIQALLCYGFLEQRQCSKHGRRYRLSWYGQEWIADQVMCQQ